MPSQEQKDLRALEQAAHAVLKPSERRPLFDEDDVKTVALAVVRINACIKETRQTQTVDVTSVFSSLSHGQQRHLANVLREAGWLVQHSSFRNEDAWILKESE